MTNVPITIPPEFGCEVFGVLYWSPNEAEMSEDMLDVRLPNGMIVSAGWNESESEYQITLTLHGQLIIPPSYTKSVAEAKERILERVQSYRWRNVSVPKTEDEEPTTKVVYLDQATRLLVVA
jgi:hypothetical protein